MRLVTENARVCCAHVLGTVSLVPGQELVRIDGRRVMVQTQPIGRPLSGCPNVGATIKPCTSVLTVGSGWSGLLRIDGKAVCLDILTGLTDGTPPGSVKYRVADPGQTLVGADA